MNRTERLLKDLATLTHANLWPIPVITALVVAVFYLVAPPPLMSTTMTVGVKSGGCVVSAGKSRENPRRQGLELKLVPNTGSRDNLGRLFGTGEVDIALVQGGQERQFEAGQARRLQTLGTVHREPLWLLHRSNVYVGQLSDLLHLRLAIDSDGSGTRAAAEAILQANDITPGHYPTTQEARGDNAVVDDLLTGKLGTALIVGLAENPAIQKLTDNDQFRLVNLRRSAAYEAHLPSPERVEVGEGLLNLPCNMPERNISTLSPMAVLVINKRFHLALIPLVLEVACEVMRGGSLLDEPGAFPSAEPRTLRLHKDAERYCKSGLPLLRHYLLFRIVSLVNHYVILLTPFIAILIPPMKSIGPLHRWRTRTRACCWYRYTRNIDHKFDSGTDTEQLRSEIKRLEGLGGKLDIAEVSLSYYRELYELYLHLNLMIKRLHGLQEHQTTQAEVGNSR